MKQSHSHIKTRRTHSVTYKRKNTKNSNNIIKEPEIQIPIKTESIFNFYNNPNGNSELEMDESTLGDIEYAKTLQMALKDAINQNEKITEELNRCIQENKELKEEIEEKDNVIYELSQYYQFCQTNHINNQINDHLNDTVDSSDFKMNSKNSSKNSTKNRKYLRSGRPKSKNKYFEKPEK